MDLFNPIIGQLISIAVAAACGYLGAQVKRLSQRDKALHDGVRSILRRQLVDDFERFVVDGHKLSIERKQEITDCYQAYAALGGNGVGKEMYEKISELKVEVVK